jgi:hypothetical protein
MSEGYISVYHSLGAGSHVGYHLEGDLACVS